MRNFSFWSWPPPSMHFIFKSTHIYLQVTVVMITQDILTDRLHMTIDIQQMTEDLDIRGSVVHPLVIGMVVRGVTGADRLRGRDREGMILIRGEVREVDPGIEIERWDVDTAYLNKLNPDSLVYNCQHNTTLFWSTYSIILCLGNYKISSIWLILECLYF